MNQRERHAAIRERRAGGALMCAIAAEFGVSASQVSRACACVRLVTSATARIRLDAAALRVIEDAKRTPAPPYKGPGSWPA